MMIEIPDLGETNHDTWSSLMDLERSSRIPWTLIGAHMVAIHAWQNGREVLRSTRDADVLVNVRAVTGAAAAFSKELLARGFDLEQPSRSGQGFRFKHGQVVVDVLVPDGLGANTSLATLQGARTIQVPGGSQALARTAAVSVRSRDAVGAVPVPNLLGAVLITIRAIAVDDAPGDKRRDAALLVSLVEEPDELISDISGAERGWLRKHSYLGDPTHETWEGIDEPTVGASVFLRLADLPSSAV